MNTIQWNIVTKTYEIFGQEESVWYDWLCVYRSQRINPLGLMTHLFVRINIDSSNGLSSTPRQTITWINDDLSSFGKLGIKIQYKIS